MLWSAQSLDVLNSVLAKGWDEHVLDALLQATGPGDVVYDIGANAGYMSLSLAAKRPEARIFSFEPLPTLAGALRASAKLNQFGNVTVYETVLSDNEGSVEFFLPTHSIHASLIARESGARRLEVKARKLDNLVRDGLIPPPTVIKVDVEGAEMLTFTGAEQTLRRYKPTLVFECDLNAARFGHTPYDVIRFLENCGYTRFDRLEGGTVEALDVGSCNSTLRPGDFRARA